MLKKTALAISAVLLTAILSASGLLSSERVEGRIFSHTTPPIVVEDLYPSMFGPTAERRDLNLYGGVPELVWVTGYKADIRDPDGAQLSQEFMCHDTLSVHSLEARRQAFGEIQCSQQRLFTLSQGQDAIQLPSGFGIPLGANENLMLQSQVLNLREEGLGAVVSHRVETHYLPDREAGQTMKALTLVEAGIALSVLDPQAEEPPTDPLGCAPDAGGQPTSTHKGHEVTSHWMVKPGYEKRETVVGKMFPLDTTAHYIGVHMHNFGKSLELYDLTADRTVFKSICTPTPDGKGLAETTYYSSEEGLKVYKDHQYKVISEYDNTSDQESTAMAFVFVYIHNPHFEKPTSEQLKSLETREEFCAIPEAGE